MYNNWAGKIGVLHVYPFGYIFEYSTADIFFMADICYKKVEQYIPTNLWLRKEN